MERLKSNAINNRPASLTLWTSEGTVVYKSKASTEMYSRSRSITYQDTEVKHNAQHVLCLGKLDGFPYT